MKNIDNIFSDEFLKIDKNKITFHINEEGIFFFKKAFSENFVDGLLNDVEKNKFSINKNWVSGVYTENQYYVRHLLGCSRSFYSLVTNNFFFNLCDTLFKKDYRLKSFRYYETYSNHKMNWHTDNMINTTGFEEIPGICFIVYLGDVMDGEFQFIKKSHKFSHIESRNDYTNDFIFKNYKQDIASYKGHKGDLVIYHTYGIHRAKPVKKKNFVRKSLIMQIDSDLKSAEPTLINPSFVERLDAKTLKFFGFGLPSESYNYPDTNINRLPLRIFFSKIFFQYLTYHLPKLIYNFLPKKIKFFLKKVLKTN